MLSRFRVIPERHGQTHGRTDRQTELLSRVSVLTRDKNCVTLILRVFAYFAKIMYYYILRPNCISVWFSK